jgi:hypothetical protein
MIGQLSTSATLPLQKEPVVYTGQEAEHASELVWTLKKRKISFHFWESDPSTLIIQPIT